VLRVWQFWLLVALATAVAILIVANMWAFSTNRLLQAEVNQRAQFVQQSTQLDQLARDIATALAQLAARHQDEQLRTMLASLGITMTTGPAAPAAASAAAGARK
jgi:hypothetical protein